MVQVTSAQSEAELSPGIGRRVVAEPAAHRLAHSPGGQVLQLVEEHVSLHGGLLPSGAGLYEKRDDLHDLGRRLRPRGTVARFGTSS